LEATNKRFTTNCSFVKCFAQSLEFFDGTKSFLFTLAVDNAKHFTNEQFVVNLLFVASKGHRMKKLVENLTLNRLFLNLPTKESVRKKVEREKIVVNPKLPQKE
jgi:hypothetical protein